MIICKNYKAVYILFISNVLKLSWSGEVHRGRDILWRFKKKGRNVLLELKLNLCDIQRKKGSRMLILIDYKI